MIRSTFTLASILTIFALSACDEDKGIGEEADADTDADSDSDADTDADTDADAYFEPVAIGFKYVGGWDSTTGELVDYMYQGKSYAPYVLLVLADLDYFSATDSAEQDAHSCEIYTSFYHGAASLTAETYDYGSGGGDSVTLWNSWDGGLYFDESLMASDACWNLDPAQYTDGMPVDLFNGIHYGFGFGPISQSLIDLFGKDFADVEDSMFGIYQAVNHPDGSGGYDFIAYDWGYSNLYTWDSDTHEIDVDDKGFLVTGNIGDPNPQGYVSSGSYWYEDFPNLDLSMLKDGAK